MWKGNSAVLKDAGHFIARFLGKMHECKNVQNSWQLNELHKNEYVPSNADWYHMSFCTLWKRDTFVRSCD